MGLTDRGIVHRRQIDRRRLLQTSGAAALTLGSGLRLGRGASAQEDITFSRDYEGTTLNLLMEDLLETTIIEEMLPEFTELTGITVNFEKVGYGVMHEKLVPQLAAGPGNGTYDVLEVDFYWVYEFARSGWVEDLGQRIADSGGAIALDRYIPATLDIVSQADGKTWYVPFYAYPMGLIYRDDLVNDEAFKEEFNAATGMELAIPDSVEGYVELAKAITEWKGEELYGAAMTAQQVDPIVMEFCNFLYSVGSSTASAGTITTPISPRRRSTTRRELGPPSSISTASTTPRSRGRPAPTTMIRSRSTARAAPLARSVSCGCWPWSTATRKPWPGGRTRRLSCRAAPG
ncbi:MAG: extracellular solute-binding protein [Thermomicrobiales bacterium]|nr:extracellular solute-binding protein [Thermomicrobiales bacterium]